MHTALEEEEITEQLKELSEWYYEKGKLVKSFTFNNFREAMSFLITVSYEAEEKKIIIRKFTLVIIESLFL